ncbi:zinc finger protein 830-like [Dreissena polymorpha]|uniref:zinc finger protein 830-like n=1 Tax=Dreissena polymorpha TaxID=45954 RepID=UPI0022650B41|nr:zinc finger protein 830-like [Dreissena polymorpha]
MATKKKKTVTKDDLRRLMKETKSAVKTTKTKVDHPLAKYNSLDQLVCIICNTAIKTELLWTTHLQSRAHKEKVDDLKRQKEIVPVKRKAPISGEEESHKKLKEDIAVSTKTSIPANFFDNGKVSDSGQGKAKKAALLAHYSSDSDSYADETLQSNSKAAKSSTSTKAMASGLPADFFDSSVIPSTSTANEEEDAAKPTAMADILPEGFFDDPKQDAKVRKVEYVDKMEEEWALFQKTLKEETHVSEAIIEEEDEQVNVDRNIDEIDEQIQCWKEVNELETKKEELMKSGPVESKMDVDSDEDLNEEALDEFLDWRSKKSWR